MATIEYAGINPESIELLNSEEFCALLTAHQSLRLITVEEDDEGDEIFTHVPLPLPEGHYDCVAVVDKADNDAFMWVLYDDCVSVQDPSPAFVEVLRVMDDYSKSTLGERLFISRDLDLYVDSPEVLTAEFDFATGDYVL